jgi:hypothetical protein
MFFDNINGTSDSIGNSNNDNDKYSLKNVSLRQGRAFLKDEKKLNRANVYLAQSSGNGRIDTAVRWGSVGSVGMNVEGFDSQQQLPEAASASASASSAPEAVSLSSSGEPEELDKLDDAFDSKMAAYSSALSEFNKELLKSQNYFVVPVKSLVPINSCFNCDASLSGTDCAAMGVSNSNGDIRTALPDSTSPTANLLPCVQSGITVPGWSADPNNSGSCIAPLGQKCCNSSMYNGQPVCSAGFGSYDEGAMNSWITSCITPPSPEEINQKIAVANEYCQGNGIGLNYWSQNANKASQSLVLVTTQEPANDAGVPYNNVRPFAKMNGIPVWMCNLGDPSGVNFFSNYEDANKAKRDLVFSSTVEKTLTSTREDMLNAATALIKAVSSQQSTTAADRKAIEQKITAIRSTISKIDSHKQLLDKSTDENSISLSSLPSLPSSSIKESFLAQEEDTRIQFKSRYAYYTVWFIIAMILIVVIFSNMFYTDNGGEGGEGGSSSSTMLIISIFVTIVFVYFIIQYIIGYFRVSIHELPFVNFNPLL